MTPHAIGYLRCEPLRAVAFRLGGGGSSIEKLTCLTVMIKLHKAELPAASVTVQSTAVTPTGNDEPEAGMQTGARIFGQLSETTGVG